MRKRMDEAGAMVRGREDEIINKEPTCDVAPCCIIPITAFSTFQPGEVDDDAGIPTAQPHARLSHIAITCFTDSQHGRRI